jgi:TolB protein
MRILQRDLARSGWFKPVGSGGEFRLLGKATESGGQVNVECRAYRTGDQRALLSKAYRESIKDADRMAHAVCDDVVQALTGHRGIAATRIAMVGNRTGKKELYLCDADGGNLLQLTRDNTVSIAPTWGPQGRKLVYTSFLKRFPDVFIVDIASGRREGLARYPGLNTGAAISPDGRDVALILSKDGNPELYIKNLAGGKLTRITRTGRAAEASPSWSPDGRRIVYVSDTSGRPQLYMVNRNGGHPERLTRRGSENVAPDWGPNNLIAFASKLGGQYQICVIDPSNRETRQITRDYADYEDPSWAPDGRHIAASRTQNYRTEVYILDTMGDAPIPLTDYKGNGDWYSPAWSPR